MSSGSFDVLGVTGRLLSIGTPAGSLDEVRWGVRAIDRLRCFFDARQAELVNEAQLLEQFPPPVPPADSDGAGEEGAAAGGDDGSGGPSAAGGLPSLGDGAAPSLSRRERELRERRAWLLGLSSVFRLALAQGRVTTGHVDVVAAVLHGVSESVRTRVLDREADLLAAAVAGSPEYVGRVVRRVLDEIAAAEGVDRAGRLRARSRLREWDDDTTGMHHVHMELEAELAMRFSAVLSAEIEAMFHSGAANGLPNDHVAVLALLNVIGAAGAGSGRRSDPARVQFSVLCDFDTLFGGLHERSVLETNGGTALHLETARRLWCDGETTWVIGVDGKSVSLVCEDELANRQQRRALRAMYRTCAHPHCDVGFDRCHIHHVTFRHLGGRTVIENLVPVCYRHHHLVHEGGWQLTMALDRTLSWYQPGGALYARCPHVPLADLDRLPRTPIDVGRSPPGPAFPPGAAPRPDAPREPRLFDDRDAPAACTAAISGMPRSWDVGRELRDTARA